MSSFSIIKKYLGLSLLAIGFIYCIFVHFETVRKLKPAGRSDILIAHWQGERGCEEALQGIIDEYNELNPETHVRQQVIIGMGSSYLRWCVTQIIGGDPPDIMEYHQGFRSYLSNYFIGLEKYVNAPNPYNKENELKDTPWKDTFYGGMFANFESELMDYYSIPNTLYTQRFYYNKEIFRRATGSDKAPQTMVEFNEICNKIKNIGVMPVVIENAKGVTAVYLFNALLSQIGWTIENEIDYNHDGLNQAGEFMRAFFLDDYQLSSPQFNAALDLLFEFSRNWGDGFNAIDNTIAPFLFIQQKGACYFGGSWLGRQMLDSCDFELGSFPLPLITENDPIAGQYYDGPWGENTKGVGMSLAISRGPSEDAAADFLRFLTSKKNNTLFNKGPVWVPGVRGSEVHPAVEGFKPLIRGKMVSLGMNSSSYNTEIKRILQNFLGETYSKSQTIEEMARVYSESSVKDNLRGARYAWRRLLKVEEVRHRTEDDLLNADGAQDQAQLRARLVNIYETQVFGANSVFDIMGVAQQKENKRD
ncbi:MAG: extracellular solute-binding protein [Phycisphaeraceae bacterium]|nr:extracellular solute-binding protein [Phycisphaeraceae bacterium]